MKALLERLERLDEIRRDKRGKVFYHVGSRPADPKPRHTSKKALSVMLGGPKKTNWSRPWMKGNVKSGVFLTSNPVGVAVNHGVFGHVYAYRLPQAMIKEAGGFHLYDWGTEILVPDTVWDKYRGDIDFLGKSMSKSDLNKKVDEVWTLRNQGGAVGSKREFTDLVKQKRLAR